MPKQVRLRVPSMTPERTVQIFLEALAEGTFDTHLDILFQAINSRIQESQQEPGDAVEPRDCVPDHAPLKLLVVGKHYGVLGEKYSGVVVMYIEDLEPRDGDGGIPKVIVECIVGNANVIGGKKYKLPVSALTEIVEDIKPVPHRPPYGYARGNCRTCGGPVEYNGKGRPPSVCAACRN